MAAPMSNNNDNYQEPTISSAQNFSEDTKCNICICVFCGLPASRKTSLLRSLTICRRNETDYGSILSQTGVLGLEYDAIIPSHSLGRVANSKTLPEQEFDGKWKSDRNQVLSSVQASIQWIQSHSGKEILLMPQPENVEEKVWLKFSVFLSSFTSAWNDDTAQVLLVIDDNMYLRSMRYEYYKLARRYGTGFCQVYLECSLKNAVARNRERDDVQQVPDEVIFRMSDKFEPPDATKYHWEKNSVTVNSDLDINVGEIFLLIQNAFLNPVKPLEDVNEVEKSRSRTECSASLLHQADLILRKCVAAKMKELKLCKNKGDLKCLGKDILQVKDKLLEDLRQGHITLMLPENVCIENSAQNPNSEFHQVIKDIFQSRSFSVS